MSSEETKGPKMSTCKDCGCSIYWAKMDNGKNWSINPEVDSEDGQVVLTVNSETGKISGRKLARGEACPEGMVTRKPHFMTCSAKAPRVQKGKELPLTASGVGQERAEDEKAQTEALDREAEKLQKEILGDVPF